MGQNEHLEHTNFMAKQGGGTQHAILTFSRFRLKKGGDFAGGGTQHELDGTPMGFCYGIMDPHQDAHN